MDAIGWVAVICGADLAGRLGTLYYQMNHSGVKTLTYRTWVLLAAFLNFAWVFYWPLGRKRN
ncbi:MAG: hypothetical protein Q4G07_05925 [Oscillospiraceae bacterium]|nr:hypothetical protein [Oscillospiraceae bacterium]